MRIGIRTLLAAGIGVVLWQALAQGADQATPATAPAPTPSFKDDKEKASYGVGMYFGNQIKRSNMDVDVDTVVAAMKDVLGGKTTRMNDQQAQESVRSYQQEARKKLTERNKSEGTAFLAQNKTKPGVKTFTVDLSPTNKVEMQYKVITEGTGAIPKSNDTVSVNYRGTLLNGEEFDSSAKHGQPGKFMANRLIRGWSEALQRMKVGSKWELYIPPTLGYGDSGTMSIQPASTLIFEVELLGIEPPQPAASAQPLTSDIIKVPSAEELKKGAKIEVIKPEEAARQAQEAQQKAAAPKK